MINFQLHEFSVLQVCDSLKGRICGSGDTLTDTEFSYRTEWLRWRLSNWQPSIVGRFEVYDLAVKYLASETLLLAEREEKK